MNSEEVNKILFKFDKGLEFGKTLSLRNGRYYRHDTISEGEELIPYTKSLDALVPLWNTMVVEPKFTAYTSGWECQIEEPDHEYDEGIWADGETMQEAAAKATAILVKVINIETNKIKNSPTPRKTR